MSRAYKFHKPDGLYFITFATVDWIDVFPAATTRTSSWKVCAPHCRKCSSRIWCGPLVTYTLPRPGRRTDLVTGWCLLRQSWQSETARRILWLHCRGHRWPRLSCGIMRWAGTLATSGEVGIAEDGGAVMRNHRQRRATSDSVVVTRPRLSCGVHVKGGNTCDKSGTFVVQVLRMYQKDLLDHRRVTTQTSAGSVRCI